MTKAVCSMVVVCAVAGCGFPQRTRVVGAGDLGSPERSRIVQYMANSLGVQEQAPDGVSRAVIADYAFRVVERSGRVCGAPATGPDQVLAVRASHAVVADTGEVFRWRLAE